MQRMVKRHYPHPHRFICVTDDLQNPDFSSEVELVRLWREFETLENPSYRGGPNCYVRLRAFSAEFEQIAGARFVSMDLDCVVTADLRPLWDREDDFVAWGAPTPRGPAINGSMWLIRSGARREVYDTFNPRISPRRSNAAGCRGSDQGWIQYVLGRHQPMWTAQHGVYSYKFDLLRNHGGRLPANARVVVFHGKPDPWDADALNKSPWIAEHYF